MTPFLPNSEIRDWCLFGKWALWTFIIVISVISGLGAGNAGAAEKLVTGERPYALELQPIDSGVKVTWVGAEEPIDLGTFHLHVYTDGWGGRLAMQGELVETSRRGDSLIASYEVGGEYGEETKLTVKLRKDNGEASITWQVDGPPALRDKAGSKTRLKFTYPNEDIIPYPHRFDTPDESSEVKNLVYGPVTLMMDFGSSNFHFHNRQPRLQVKLGQDSRKQLLTDGVTLKLMLEKGGGWGSILNSAERKLDDVGAYLEVIDYRDLATEKMEKKLSRFRDRLNSLRDELAPVPAGIEKGHSLLGPYRRSRKVEASAGELRAALREYLWENRDVFYPEAKVQNERIHFGVGYSTDTSITKEIPKYAIFGVNFFRFAPGRLGIADYEKRMEKTRGMMKEFAEFGAEGMFTVGAHYDSRGPEDMTWDHNLLPTGRQSFYHANLNSRRVRDAWGDWAERAGPELKDIENLRVIQLGNEPFWDASASNKVGYNPAEVGCSNATWRKAIQRQYDSSDEWLKQVEKRKEWEWGENSEQWASIEDAGFNQEYVQGYTFVDFLKDRHGDLKTLNEMWFGEDEDRYYSSWQEVFPPIPTAKGGATESDLGAVPDAWTNAGRTIKPKAKDVPAWVDWMEMGGYFVSDAHSEYRRELVQAGVTDKIITTNAVMGHYINDFGWNAADVGCYPWITMNGLDAHGIDFYTIAYMQAYIASLRDADVYREKDRPVFVHEIRWAGNRNKEGPHIAMFCFAHGADGLVFFDHQRDFYPRDTVGVAKLMDAMAEKKLQFESEPVTDGVAALYSMSSLWVTDAVTGSGRPYMVHFQSTVTTLDRMQVLYNVYADRQIEKGGVPDGVSVLMAPGAEAMNDTTLANIRAFVEDGGTLVTTPDFARVTRYGRSRPKAERDWIREFENVVILDGEALDSWTANWQRGKYKMQRGLGWANKSLPKVAETLEPVISQEAPRTVRYLDGDGEMDARKTGARVCEDGTLYVFVDPWADEVQLEVRGAFESARNLYTDESLPVESTDAGTSRVRVDGGPAIVRFNP